MSKLIASLREHALVELKTKMPQNKKQNVIAIVYDKQGKILCFGENSFVKTSRKQAELAKQAQQESKQFLHAEIAAILRWRRFSDKIPYGIFVGRLGKNGELALARPCAICELAIKESGIKHITFTEGFNE